MARSSNILDLALIIIMALWSSTSVASDPSPLQDFCVADTSSDDINLNGVACIDASKAEAEDFFYSGLDIAGNTSNRFGLASRGVGVFQIPGLNTLGLTIIRVDMAPWGFISPHIHPRASEVVLVLQGAVEVGFITSNPENKLFSKVLKKGDVFVIPVGLIHFQRNVGRENAFSIISFSSQSPGALFIASDLFGSNPLIPSDLLAKAFQVDQNVVDYLQTIF